MGLFFFFFYRGILIWIFTRIQLNWMDHWIDDRFLLYDTKLINLWATDEGARGIKFDFKFNI